MEPLADRESMTLFSCVNEIASIQCFNTFLHPMLLDVESRNRALVSKMSLALVDFHPSLGFCFFSVV